MECLLFCTTQLAKCMEAEQLSAITDVVQLVMKLIDSSSGPSICDKYIAMRLQCIDFICAISCLMGKFGDQAGDQVKQFTEFALKGFPDAKLTLNDSAKCFV